MAWSLAIAGGTVVAATALLHVFGSALHLDVTESEIANRLSTTLEQKNCLAIVLCVSFVEPQVRLVSKSQQVNIASTLVLDVASTRHRLPVSISGRMRYDSDTGRVYLDAAEISGIDVDTLPAAVRAIATTRAPSMIRSAFEVVPIYRMDQHWISRCLHRYFIQDVVLTDGALRVEFGKR